jgi:hypothetical protein
VPYGRVADVALPSRGGVAVSPAVNPGDEDGILALVAEIQAEVTGASAWVGIAEDEIEQAAGRHPEAADDLYHAFALMLPATGAAAWETEFVYRAHCRELLERVAAGEDTRPGTTAEAVLAISEVSKKIPLTGTAAGLYFRMWSRAFPGHELTDRGEHYEALYKDAIDKAEGDIRQKLNLPGRVVLRDFTCDGTHHGEPVQCKYQAEAGA